MVNFDVAIDSGETGLAATFVTGFFVVYAISAVFARLVGTSGGFHFAMLPVESQGANASVIVDSGSLASSTVDAQIMRTFIGDPNFAIGTGPSRGTGTSIRTLTGIETGGAILTRLVICAIVQILVAKKAAPAFFANASPRFVAFSVLATRVSHTFRAKISRPSVSALALTGSVTVTVFVVASRTANGFGTVISFFVVGVFLPPIQANFVALRVTSIMAKLVITRSAQSVAIIAVIVSTANHSIFIFESGMSFLVNSVSPS